MKMRRGSLWNDEDGKKTGMSRSEGQLRVREDRL